MWKLVYLKVGGKAKMRAKMVLLAITMVAIAGIAFPQTLSLFAGQHYWYDLNERTNDVPCEKCHADVAAEMESALGPHMGETGYGRMQCEYCHRTGNFTGYIYASVSGGYSQYEPGVQAHAASTVACMDCHGFAEWGPKNIVWGSSTPQNCTACHPYDNDWDHVRQYNNDYYNCLRCHGWEEHPEISGYTAFNIPPAGGFGLTSGYTPSQLGHELTDDTGNMSAHLKFVQRAMNSTLMTDENEACIACHTAVSVKINFTHKRSLEFVVGLENTITTTYGPHNWSVTAWQANRTAYATVWGNTTGSGTTTYTANWPGNVDSIYT